MSQGERGRTGDHGQTGSQGERGATGATGNTGKSFSRTQVGVMFVFVVFAFVLLAIRSEYNAGKIDVLERQVLCLQNPKACEAPTD